MMTLAEGINDEICAWNPDDGKFISHKIDNLIFLFLVFLGWFIFALGISWARLRSGKSWGHGFLLSALVTVLFAFPLYLVSMEPDSPKDLQKFLVFLLSLDVALGCVCISCTAGNRVFCVMSGVWSLASLCMIGGFVLLASYSNQMMVVERYSYYGPMRVTEFLVVRDDMLSENAFLCSEMPCSYEGYRADLRLEFGYRWGCPCFSNKYCTSFDTFRPCNVRVCDNRDGCSEKQRTAAHERAVLCLEGFHENAVNLANLTYEPVKSPLDDSDYPTINAFGDCDKCDAKISLPLQNIKALNAVGFIMSLAGSCALATLVMWVGIKAFCEKIAPGAMRIHLRRVQRATDVDGSHSIRALQQVSPASNIDRDRILQTLVQRKVLEIKEFGGGNQCLTQRQRKERVVVFSGVSDSNPATGVAKGDISFSDEESPPLTMSTCKGQVFNQSDCGICLMSYEVNDDVCFSKNQDCLHSFHQECIVEWLARNLMCPCCRRSYVSADIDAERATADESCTRPRDVE